MKITLVSKGELVFLCTITGPDRSVASSSNSICTRWTVL